MKKLTSKKGFTLVEMLVVIAIIAVLVAIIIPTVSSATKKAKAATDAANLRSAKATLTIAALDGSLSTYASASGADSPYDAQKLGIPTTSKSDGTNFYGNVTTNDGGVTVVVNYGGSATDTTHTIDSYAAVAGGTATPTTSP